MQPRPRADELLAAVADVLDREIVPALTGVVQHHARVAASLVAIVGRELRLGPDVDQHEVEVLQRLLDTNDGDVAGMRSRLAAELRVGLGDDHDRTAQVWAALMDLVRHDLTISRPGHDSWVGE